MRRLRRWIAARLWRRLASSHLIVTLLTILILQLTIAVLAAFVALVWRQAQRRLVVHGG